MYVSVGIDVQIYVHPPAVIAEYWPEIACTGNCAKLPCTCSAPFLFNGLRMNEHDKTLR